MRIILTLLLLLPLSVEARMYMCVDPATGKTSFTDRACDSGGAGEKIKVQTTNLDSGRRSGKAPKNKTWNSQRDNRKSGVELNAERRAMYENRATAEAE
ncbi:MAG: DUF4124 domain-containing protein [Pseudomonadota bacterium]